MGLKVLGVLFFSKFNLPLGSAKSPKPVQPADFDPQVPTSSESLRILDTRPLQNHHAAVEVAVFSRSPCYSSAGRDPSAEAEESSSKVF